MYIPVSCILILTFLETSDIVVIVIIVYIYKYLSSVFLYFVQCFKLLYDD